MGRMTDPVVPSGLTADQLRARELHGYALAYPAGFTNRDLKRDKGWTPYTVSRAASALRRAYREDAEEMTLAVVPQRMHEPWLYMHVSTADDALSHQDRRLRNAHTAVLSARDSVDPITIVTDRRTVEGKRLAKVSRSLAFVDGELEDLVDAFAEARE